MLVNDPETVPARGDDEAIVNLAEGPQVLQCVQTFRLRQRAAREQGAVGIGNGHPRRDFRGKRGIREIKTRWRRWWTPQHEFGQRRGVVWFPHHWEGHVFRALSELRIG